MPGNMDKSMLSSPYHAGFYGGKAQASRPQRPVSGIRPSVALSQNTRQNGTTPKTATTPDGKTVLPLTPREVYELEQARKHNQSYFFVMRKGVCALMCFFFLLYVAAIAVSAAGIEVISPYTSMLTVQDNTPYDERSAYETEEGLIYPDQSRYVSFTDALFGDGLNAYEKLPLIFAKVPSVASALKDAVGLLVKNVDAENNYYFSGLKLLEDRLSDFDLTPTIVYFLYNVYPRVLAVAAVIALISMVTAGVASRGKRIFKGYALIAVVMLIASVVSLAAQFALANIVNSNPKGMLDFSQLIPFLTGGFSGPPFTATDALADPPLVLVAGYLNYVLVGIPIIILILSVFCRKKVSYRVFDK